MGISLSAFTEIWTDAGNRAFEEMNAQLSNSDAETAVLSLTSYFANSQDFPLISRVKNLDQILHNEAAFSSNPKDLKKRLTLLTMLKTSDLWNSKIAESYSPKKIESLL